jgi:hypothetical protein
MADGECIIFWRLLYALALAQAIDRSPFVFNPHRLPYKPYRCVKCWRPAGTRAPCECSSKG